MVAFSFAMHGSVAKVSHTDFRIKLRTDGSMESGDEPYGWPKERCFQRSRFGTGSEPCDGSDVDGVMTRCRASAREQLSTQGHELAVPCNVLDAVTAL